MPIFDRQPTDWNDLQNLVGQLFNELGCEVEVGKKVKLVRGAKEIDVYVVDQTFQPQSVYLCECKLWSNPIPQEVVHSFRTVLADFGAHRGYIISKAGFQAGAWEAAKNTNIDLVTYEELQDIFFARWRQSMGMRYEPYADAMFPYWDPTGGKPVPAIWGHEQQMALRLLNSAYHPFCLLGPLMAAQKYEVALPMTLPALNHEASQCGVIKIETYRQFYDFVEKYKEQALRHYKELFKDEPK